MIRWAALLAGAIALLLAAHVSAQRCVARPPDQARRAVRPRRQQRHHRARAGEQAGRDGSGQPVVVENKGGAGGTIGTDYVAKSPPDGYTILFVSTSITTNAASGKQLPYDLLKDLQPIGEVAAGAFVVVVSNDLKVTTLREFIDLARAKPDSISYGSAGIGGINHLGTELFASAAKVQLVHVPYKGIGPAFTDIMGGNLQMALPTLASAVQHIHSGKMRGLAVTGRATLAACACAADRGRGRAAGLRARSVVGHRGPRPIAGSGAQAAQRGVERRARAA